MGTRCSLGALSAVLALVGCAAGRVPMDEPVGEADSAIQGGFPDISDTAVVGLAVTDGAGHPLRTCSGTLIAPNLVLTAQHCVASTAKYVDCETSVFGDLVDARRVLVTPSNSMWRAGADWYRAAEVMTPPGDRHVCGHDLALVRLEQRIDDQVRPIEPCLSDDVEAQESYTAIGYGESREHERDAGLRRRRDQLRVLCVGSECDTGQVGGSEWRGDFGICDGDSGGPAIDAQGRVIGVTSRGPAGCDQPIYGRLLSHADWLKPEGVRAAQAGDYHAPRWTAGAALVPASEDCTGGCSLGKGRPSGAGAVLAAVLAAVSRRRNRARPRSPAHT